MAEILKPAAGSRSPVTAVTLVRLAIVVAVLALWQILAASGLFYRDVVPSLPVVARATAKLLAGGGFYWNLGITIEEIAIGLLIGGSAGLAAGLALGGSHFLGAAFEPYLYYLGPTPKIVFFPVMIMWFGVGSGSKAAMAALSCFFPIALSVAGGMRQIDRVLIRVGRSLRANAWQMTVKIYLPALRGSLVNGLRLGLGVALIGTLLAETKLSNQGIGYLVIQAYASFDMPRLYAILIVLFALSIGINVLVARLAGLDAAGQK